MNKKVFFIEEDKSKKNILTIFIDIDNIVADFETAFRIYINKKLNKNLRKEDICYYEFHRCFNINESEEMKLHNDFIEDRQYEKIKPISGTKEGIQGISQNSKIKFITSRSEDLEKKTRNWFIRHKIPVNSKSFIFTDDKISYSKYFDLIIEDKWEDALKIAYKNKKVILFDYPWNRKYDKHNNIIKHINISRVENWIEAVKAVKKMKKEIMKTKESNMA